MQASVQTHNFHSTYTTGLKLSTLVHHHIRVCMPRTITLTSILFDLWPFFDLEFLVKVCVQASYLHTSCTIALTLVHHHDPEYVCQEP